LDIHARTSYLEFISLCAHEYFHLWNVKRLRPAALGPFNYGEENYTTGLWVAEGFTSYFDDLIVYRAGIYTENEYLNVVEKNINDAENAPGKHVQSVAEASFDAWIKYYRQNENSNNSQVNYYVRGGVLALLLDLMIIRHSKGLYNINDVMRDAYNQFYLQRNQGFTEAELKAIIEQYAGENLDWFYDNHVFGTKQIDYSIFAAFGLQLVNQNEGKLELDLGIVINDKNAIQSVRKNSACEKGGLNVNDEIIAINNFRYTTGLLNQFTENKSAGDTLQITISRSGMLQTFDVTLQNTDKVDYKLTPLENSGAAQKSLYEIWLKR
jgi:predicted metalloprotease with PDZ domain